MEYSPFIRSAIKGIVNAGRYDKAVEALEQDPESYNLFKLFRNARLAANGCIHSLNYLWAEVKRGELSEADYFEAKKGYNGEDINEFYFLGAKFVYTLGQGFRLVNHDLKMVVNFD